MTLAEWEAREPAMRELFKQEESEITYEEWKFKHVERGEEKEAH